MPNLFKGFFFDVADAYSIVVAAWDCIAVFSYAEEFAEKASTQEETIVPFFKIGHAPLFGYPSIERNIDVYGWFALVFLGQIVEFVT